MTQSCWYNLFHLMFASYCIGSALTLAPAAPKMNRKLFFQRLAGLTLLTVSLSVPRKASALAGNSAPYSATRALPTVNGDVKVLSTIAYKQLSLPMNKFGGIDVPVACWFSVDTSGNTKSDSATTTAGVSTTPASYQHRISVRRIGQLLAGWDFIPDFVSKNYQLAPSSQTARIVDGRNVAFPTRGPVVLLAHGYLGSRFDLSHLAEELAAAGFICVAAEYPESLAASYDRRPGLDRTAINAVLLAAVRRDWGVTASAYGIVGHSLGCGTVLQTGDDRWARVSIAGFPRQRDGTPVPGNGLLLTSMNDGAASLVRMGGMDSVFADCNYEMLQESAVLSRIPRRAAIVFDRPDAPNHISFLSEGVNDAMIEFLSPLLPVAQAFSIPVLDFDRYKKSRDSVATAAVVHPIIVQYLKQEMLARR